MKVFKKYSKVVWVVISIPILLSFIFQKNSDQDGPDVSYRGVISIERATYVAGDTIVIPVEVEDKAGNGLKKSYKPPQLLAFSAFGNTLITPISTPAGWTFTLPEELSTKAGLLSLKLILGNRTLDSQSLIILPNSEVNPVLESYIGPPSMKVGGTDFSMLVAMPTDKYDNLLLDSTEIVIHEYFELDEVTTNTKIENGIAWKNVYSPDRSGRIIVSAECNGTISKELVADVFPANPKNFTISADRVHPYADGNEIVSFRTSQILDIYNNLIADGTMVEFVIRTSTGEFLHTSGSTIMGYATGKMLHPSIPGSWKVSAYITGMAESEEIELEFKPIMNDFSVHFSEDNRTIQIGPLTSYLGQLIPDGAEVVLTINNGEQLTKSSKSGMVSFSLSDSFFADGNIEIGISAFGITKKYNKTLH